MRNFIFLLLSILSLQVHGQASVVIKDTAYYPYKDELGRVIRPVAFSVVKATQYEPGKKYAPVMNIHGIGEISEGKLENLRNVTLGFDYDGNGPEPRRYAIATPDFLAARDQYDILAITPTHDGDMTPEQINYIWQQVEKDYSVDTSRRGLVGFSLGGKIVTRYMSSSPANAAKIAMCVAVAPVNGIVSCKVVADAGLPFIGATIEEDPRVSPTNVKNIISCILAQIPRVPPYYIEFDGNGHGGINELLSLYHPNVPQNIYSFLRSVTNTNRKAYPTSTNITQPPVTPPPSGTPVIKTWVRSNVTSTDTIGIRGCSPLSSGYDHFTYAVTSVPVGVNIYTPIVQSGGYCQTLLKFPKEGAYTIVARACKGTTCVTDTLYLTYQKVSVPVPVTPMTFDSSTGYLVLSDGSRIRATVTVDWATKKVVVKGEDGVTYTL